MAHRWKSRPQFLQLFSPVLARCLQIGGDAKCFLLLLLHTPQLLSERVQRPPLCYEERRLRLLASVVTADDCSANSVAQILRIYPD
jgi:hypothetical protein